MKSIWMRSALVGALCACVVTGCGQPDMQDAGADRGTLQDVAADRGVDAPLSSDTMVGADARADAATDIGVVMDAGADVTIVDARPDALPVDVVTVVDAGRDVPGTDTPPPVDAGTVDAGSCPLSVLRVLTVGSTYNGSIAAGSPNRIASSGCGGDGPEDIFILHIATAADVVLSTSSPMTIMDTVIRLRRLCDQEGTEFDCNDDVDDTNTAAYLPTRLEPGDYFLIVDTYGPGAAGTYVLSIFTPSPSHIDSITATACDPMDTAAILPGVAADDSASPITALPFAFRFVGETSTHFSATSNGYAQLWTSATGTPSTQARNREIPFPGLPNNIVAPFWENLAPATGVAANVRSATFGTAPMRHFTIQWSQWSFETDFGARLTFQAKLFETTGVIEFHYCTLTAGTEITRARGHQASIGIEDSAGLHGTSLGYHVMDNVSTTEAFRLTPR